AFELFALEEDLRLARRDVHVAAQVVDDLDLVAARFAGLAEAGGRIQRRVAGEDGDLHEGRENLSPPPRNERPGSTTKRRRTADRPSNIRKPISSRLVRLNSIERFCPRTSAAVRITGRSSTSPFELRTSRCSTSG